MSIKDVEHDSQLEDIPELIHSIQSLLPAKEAARTCILSKSWLHAWSTIPTLRFSPELFQKFVTDEKEIKYKKVIDHTLQRYHRNNISIESLDLELHIQNQESAFAAEKWIQPIVSKSCLKELSLNIWGLNDHSFTLPNELFFSEKLSTINISGWRLRICSNPVIKCVTLRVLVLEDVNVTEEVVHNLLSTCTLLEKIKLWRCKGLENVLVKNLRHLRELVIKSSLLLEIKDVPSLRLFDYNILYCVSNNPVPFKIDSLASVRKLSLGGVIVLDHAFLDIIKSKCILLECLTLGIKNCGLESLVITSASLKTLTLSIWEDDRQVNVHVYAPKLLYLNYYGKVHGLLFPTIAPNPAVPLNIDVDDLRRRRSSVQDTNVQTMAYKCAGLRSIYWRINEACLLVWICYGWWNFYETSIIAGVGYNNAVFPSQSAEDSARGITDGNGVKVVCYHEH
ncbi:F-box protein-like protein [Tanacetum coccineum]